MPVYLVGYASRFVGLETPEQNSFDQFWKFKFYGPNYMYQFRNHRQTFLWPGERPSSHLKVTKMWFDPNIKYLSEPFYADFCCRDDIPSYLCIPYEIRDLEMPF